MKRDDSRFNNRFQLLEQSWDFFVDLAVFFGAKQGLAPLLNVKKLAWNVANFESQRGSNSPKLASIGVSKLLLIPRSLLRGSSLES
jgi:hypothetical protein